MPLYKWSQTSANNASADSTINWAEGMAPSAVNDSARAMMSAVAQYRDDQAGSLILVNSGTAYTVSSNQGFTSTTDLDKQMITFVAGFTSGANPTLNVDGLGAFSLVTANGVAVPAGAIVATAIYSATFYKSFNEFRLHAFYNNSTYNIPLGGLMDYICPTVPNSNFVFPVGQPISRVTYATLFAAVGTTYGVGDGTTTFNVPDLTGFVTAMKEASATRLTSTYFGGNSTVLGARGGLESHTLAASEMPAHNHGVNDPGHVHNMPLPEQGQTIGGAVPSQLFAGQNTSSATTLNVSSSSATTGISIQNAGSGGAHAIVQPTMIVNKILRII